MLVGIGFVDVTAGGCTLPNMKGAGAVLLGRDGVKEEVNGFFTAWSFTLGMSKLTFLVV